MPAQFLQLDGICKRFPGVVALDRVSLSVEKGEVIALIGENGAGKSTLMKILGGIHQPDEGRILIDTGANASQVVPPAHSAATGERKTSGSLSQVSIRSVAESVKLGIGFVHQELKNLDNLDVAGNLFLGREPTWGGPLKLVDRSRMVAASRPYLERLGLRISPKSPLKNLSIAQQQMVEIARALSQDARILVLDEPTSSLTSTETDLLLSTVNDLKKQGVSVIYISHRLGEISKIADRVVALRDGRNAGELPREKISHDAMVRLMIGRDLQSLYVPGTPAKRADRLSVRGARTTAHPKETVTLDADAGEILGIAGLVGAGRSEVAEAIFGVNPLLEGEILMDGFPLRIRSSRDAIKAGIFLVTEDRRRTGLVTSMTIRENITLPGLWGYTRAALINRKAETEEAQRQVTSLRVKTPGVEARVMNLSGGNQQKVVLGKWLALDPKVLIVDEPTRGIDVGSKAEIYRLLRALAEKGVAIIVISSDLEEVLGVSDRIAVMHEGRIAGILERDQCTEESVMSLAFGKSKPVSFRN